MEQEKNDFISLGKLIGEWIEQSKLYVLNLEKEKKIYEVQQQMQEILDEETIETKVEIKPCPLGMGDVVIQFESDSITIRNIEKFQKIICETDNFEIYPTKNGIKFAAIISGVAKVITY